MHAGAAFIAEFLAIIARHGVPVLVAGLGDIVFWVHGLKNSFRLVSIPIGTAGTFCDMEMTLTNLCAIFLALARRKLVLFYKCAFHVGDETSLSYTNQRGLIGGGEVIENLSRPRDVDVRVMPSITRS